MGSCHQAVRKCLKCYKKVFIYVLYMALINTYLLHKLGGGNISRQLTFREEVVRGLLQEYLPDAPN